MTQVHYLNCQDENCEKFACVARRDYEQKLLRLETQTNDMQEVLEFYADPETYFAIGFIPDRPCGSFIEDASETHLGNKPGKLAREVLEKHFGPLVEVEEET